MVWMKELTNLVLEPLQQRLARLFGQVLIDLPVAFFRLFVERALVVPGCRRVFHCPLKVQCPE